MGVNISKSCPDLILKDFSLGFPGAEKPLWQHLDMQIAAGTIVGIRGPNASGKSSLLNAICKVIPEYIKAEISGSIFLGEMDLATLPLKEIYRYMAVLLSDFSAQLLFPTSELEIAFALENMGLSPLEIRHRIVSSLACFNGQHLYSRNPTTLSKGEQKLLILACINALDSPVLLLDEPESGLSDKALQNLLAWLQKQREAQKIVLLASHNPEVLKLCDSILHAGEASVSAR